jgi:hypothetical protein
MVIRFMVVSLCFDGTGVIVTTALFPWCKEDASLCTSNNSIGRHRLDLCVHV